MAQETTPAASGETTPAASDETTEEGDIVVTAQKRVERLIDVPLAVSAVSAETLVNRGQTQLQSYYTSVPGLNLNQQGNGFTTLAIRGIISGLGTNPTVGIVIDDIPYGSSTLLALGGRLMPDLDPSTLARIEVLRGPQGTLYGASSMGGLMKFVTTDPSTDRVSGIAEISGTKVAHGDFGFSGRAAVNSPLSDSLAVSVSGFYRRDPGYVDNVRTGVEDVNETNVMGGRVAMLWKASDDISVKLSALIQRTRGEGTAEIETRYDYTPVYGEFRQSRILGSGQFEADVNLFSAIVSADLGSVSLSSLTGYSVNRFFSTSDLTPSFGAFGPLFFGPTATGTLRSQENRTRKFTQELRLASEGANVLDWRIGAFYTHENSDGDDTIDAVNAATGQFVGTFTTTPFDPSYSKLEEISGFADATLHLGDAFSLQLGGRFSHNKQDYRSSSGGILFGFVDSLIEAQTSEDTFTYSISPQYKFGPDLLLYARLSTGYRIGGPNPGAIPGVPATYGSDKTTNYEIGLKGEILDRLITFDLTAYHIDWKDIQIRLQSSSGFSYYANAAGAKSDGVEASVTVRPTEGLSIAANAAYNNAVLTQPLPASSPAPGASGDRLPSSAKFSGSISADYTFPVGGDSQAFVGGTASHVGDRKGDFLSGTTLRQTFPAYTTLDLRAGVTVNTWSFRAYATNVTNTKGVLNSIPSSQLGVATVNSIYSSNFLRPATYGLAIGKKF